MDRYESGVDRDRSAGDRADLVALTRGRLRRLWARPRVGAVTRPAPPRSR
jgi:hypothetical protein